MVLADIHKRDEYEEDRGQDNATATWATITRPRNPQAAPTTP
jgi:hypothetical protein